MACFDKKLIGTDCAGSDTVRGAAQPGGGGGAPQVRGQIPRSHWLITCDSGVHWSEIFQFLLCALHLSF
jgi:hypothetical protein